MKHLALKKLLVLLSIGFSTIVQAEDAKHNQVIITANKASVDQLNNTVIYQGNVVITRTNFEIKAQKVVYTTTQETQVFVCEGKQVEVSWNDETTNTSGNQARADYIKYIASPKQILDMRGSVWVDVQGNTVESEEITYDFESSKLSAQGSNNQRVKFVLTVQD